MLKNQVMEETLSKKWVSPKQMKRAVKDAAERGLLNLSWSTYSYRPKQASKKAQRIVTLSWEHPRYAYRRIRALLVKEGWSTCRKFVQRYDVQGAAGKTPEKAQTPSRGLYRTFY